MPVNPGDTIRVTLAGTCFQQRILCDLSYEVTVGNAVLATPVVLSELINQISAAGPNSIWAEYRACLPPQWLSSEIRAQVILPQRSAFVSIGFNAFPGLNVNPTTSATRQAAITRRTNIAGRNQTSTLKVGPAPDAGFSNGLVTAAYEPVLSAFGGASIKPLLLPISTVQLVSTILTPGGSQSGSTADQLLRSAAVARHVAEGSRARRVTGGGTCGCSECNCRGGDCVHA